MKIKLLLLSFFTVFSSCTNDLNKVSISTFDAFCSARASGWGCQIFQGSFDNIPIPKGVENPLAVVKYDNPNRTFTNYNSKINPSLFLQIYDISKKPALEKIIAKSILYSWCIPIFYGENEKYYVITSPCYINSGSFTDEANGLIKPLHQSLKSLFTRTAPSFTN